MLGLPRCSKLLLSEQSHEKVTWFRACDGSVHSRCSVPSFPPLDNVKAQADEPFALSKGLSTREVTEASNLPQWYFKQ